MKEYEGHLYETVESWHPVIIRSPIEFYDKIVYLPCWLRDHCPNADEDYDAWCYPDDDLLTPGHRTIYFFRDPEVATMFALRWS
jgi:hypothetical protein